MNEVNPLDIAIIGMACYFPEADNVEQYWNNLKNGVCSVKFHTDEELIQKGVSKKYLNNPDYVKASPYFSRSRYFDASFFNINPGEANIMDPQRRLFIENCWQALEDAGYDPLKYPGKIGVFGSAGINFYMANLMDKQDLIDMIGPLQMITSNDKDGLPTQASYLMNLTGPSININTACSSTLVAIHLARQSLLLGDSDMVLAGGAAIIIPENVGYQYERDSILSHDGYCRAFDDDADGTLWGSGSGVVLLKRLEDAIADGDNIRAVIKGSAINNDGSHKVGYTAPSIEGQSEVIVQAYSSSGISPETVQYIEAHGTGTKLGDPVEVAALTRAFREYTPNKKFCGLGSVKTNFGHLGASAGIASIIKAVLILENKMIPPSLHFKKGNRNIDFENSPFYVNTQLNNLADKPYPIRVGVSSLGVGGTNSHIILEEVSASYKSTSIASKGEALLLLSARNPIQLDQARKNLLTYLEKNKSASLQNIAYTLQTGRRTFQYKLALFAHTIDEAIAQLSQGVSQLLTNDNYKQKVEKDKSTINTYLYNWFEGKEANWEKLIEKGSYKKVNLPTYPFSNDVYWIEPSNKETKMDEDDTLAHKIDSIQDWFYLHSWTQSALPSENAVKHTGGNMLVFVDEAKFGFKIGTKLKQYYNQVTFVYSGTSFKDLGNNTYQINLEDSSTYHTLFKNLSDKKQLPDTILHFFGLNGSVNGNYITRVKSLFSFQKNGLFSFLYMIKAINANSMTHPVNLISFVNHIADIAGDETIYPEKTSVLSSMKVIQQEYPNFKNRTIEIEDDYFKNEANMSTMVNEILSNNSEIVCSYRGKKRWVLNYQPLKLDEATLNTEYFKKNSVIFAFGGLTGGMVALYEYLIQKYQVKLIVMDDSYLPKEKDWENWLEQHGKNEYNSLRIKTVKKLKKLGAEYIDGIDIIYGHKDLISQINAIEKKVGKINGLIHAAGGYAAGRMSLLSETESNIQQLGMYNLASIGASFIIIHELFKNKQLDFRFLWTSLSNVLAGPSFISYCAADSIAISSAIESNKKLTTPWTVFNWDSLQSEWDKDLVEENMAKVYPLMQSRIDEGLISTDEGNQCMEIMAALGSQFNPVVLSCSDLYKRYNIWIKMEKTGNKGLTVEPGANNSKPRPNLMNPYEAPVSETEILITGIMENTLCVDQIGRTDNFFDLGGNSLVAIQFASKVRELTNVEFAMGQIFDHQSVSDIAHYIESEKSKMA